MKLICKDYYKYSLFISTLVTIEQVFSLNSFERYYTIMDHFPLESILLYLKKDKKRFIREKADSILNEIRFKSKIL